MLGNIVALYKARKDLSLAKTIASEMVVDGTIDRLGWPLMIAKLWMSLGLLILFGLILAFLWIGTASHWTLGTPILLFGGLGFAIIRVWRGLNRGVEKISHIAKTELNQRVQAMTLPSKQADKEDHPEV
jgi:hypothetical protein